eukprot:TRINITY_DN24581_c0_g1_i1.p1 TRINITY_DN24581_c0_g1~~TRINITY_DN24581_c0_g1_i1.p1  ORF type:complete len:438 (-),score=57.29 TRINITY_DN24581_c0_g1_i1:229-1542(-)
MLPFRKNRRIAIILVFLSLAVFYFVFPFLFPGGFLNLHLALGGPKGNPDTSTRCNNRLKVYMYDLPRRFNFGILQRNDLEQDLPWPHDKKAPLWPKKIGLRKQHNVEYWMTLDLLGQREYAPGLESQAVRVENPEEADVFFVPFFSSLSFNTYGKTMRDPDTEYDKALQAELVAFLKASEWWQKSLGRDHVIPMHHPNSFRFFRDELNSSILIVADFGRSSANISRLGKDVVAPYTHVVKAIGAEKDPYRSRNVLLYFQGQIVRKDEGIVRAQLEKLLKSHPRVHFEDGTATPQGVKQATEGMRASLFCLHPAGDTPSSCRLFDAIASHCVPIIVSDKIELPFEDELDYREFCLFFSVEEALQPGYLLKALENISERRWLELWSRLKDVGHHFNYEGPSQPEDAINMIWRQLHNRLPSIKLAINRSKRLKIKDWIWW